jgi:hypothetical protein
VGRVHETLDESLQAWIGRQRMFFVATAPLAADGHVNCSPKGGTLHVLGPRRVAYVDTYGSGIETVAHARENGRIVVMLCAFEGPPRIVRLHGRACVVDAASAEFAALLGRMIEPWPSARAIVRVDVTRIADSCGYGVPLMRYEGERPQARDSVQRSSEERLREKMRQWNRASLDGLPALDEAAVRAARFPRPG